MPDRLKFTRRGFVTAGLTASAIARLQSAAAQSFLPASKAKVCSLSAEQEIGPYYVADELLRSNIVEGRPGVPLNLQIAVMNTRTCEPLANAAVDIWHCDALGLYSGFTKQDPHGPGGPPPPGFGPPREGFRPPPPDGGPGRPMGPPPQNHPTDKLTFLRGIQLTNANGLVTFQTVFPGFYMGRTNHIHFKVRVGGHAETKTYAAGHTSHTGQIFFPEDFAAKLMEQEPYREHKIHRTTQAEDNIYGDQHGSLSVAQLDPAIPHDLSAGLHATLIAGVDPEATPSPVGRRMGPPPRS